PCAARRWRCDADLANDLVGLERRSERVDEEVPCCNAPFAIRAHSLELGVQGEEAGREIAERIGMRGRPANRPTVAHLRVANLGGGATEQRQLFLEQVGELDVV